ncbi:MAG: glycosyltransferase [Candidatus Saccharimonadales bacterium]
MQSSEVVAMRPRVLNWHQAVHFFLRVARFGMVGTVCLLVQLGIMWFLVNHGIHESPANSTGFLLSAQLNFVLSRNFTWGDRTKQGLLLARRFAQWVAFNSVVLAGAVVNFLAFAGATMLDVPIVYAAIAAVVLAMGVTFTLHHFGVFRRRRPEKTALVTADQLRQVATPPDMTRAKEGVAFFMPAWNEQGNIRTAVESIRSVLSDLGMPFHVFVIDDGSTDLTHAVAKDLAKKHGDVTAVHQRNQGYGGALRTGFKASYESGYGLIAFYDSDNQFHAEDFLRLLGRMHETNADMVVGQRIKRADGLRRLLMGKLWHWLGRVALGYSAHDVDCGFKLMRREVLEKILPHLRGEKAAISPELLAYACGFGFNVQQVGVRHRPRLKGEQSGASLPVVIGSIIGLFKIRSNVRSVLLAEGIRKHRRRRIDPVVKTVVVLASLLSIGAFTYFYARGETLAYTDSISHLMIARRTIDSPTQGLAQLGGVWPPLPHLLMLPFIWNNWLYYSGVGGSIASMLAYVVATVLIYKFVRSLTKRAWPAVAAAAIFALNPNVLYMQATPMTEMLLLASIMGAVYGLLRWIQTKHYLYLIASAGAALGATLIRYEGWVLVIALVPVIVFAVIRQRLGRAQLEGALIAFLTMAGAGIGGWLLWNQLIFNDWLAFQRGEYAKSSLWVGAGELAVGQIDIAFMAYTWATLGNVTLVFGVLAAVGLIVYLVRSRLSAESAPALALLAFFPFFVLALYAGQRPLHVTQIHNDMYNTRFGLVMILPTAVFVGYLVSVLRRPKWRALQTLSPILACCLAVGVSAAMLASGNTITLQDPLAEKAEISDQLARAEAAFLRDNYTGGKVLVEAFGNESVVFHSRIPPGEVIYEGSYRIWEPALANPLEHDIQWIIMRRTPGTEDLVYKAVRDTARLQGNLLDGFYVQVYADSSRLIFASPQAQRKMSYAQDGTHLQDGVPITYVPKEHSSRSPGR